MLTRLIYPPVPPKNRPPFPSPKRDLRVHRLLRSAPCRTTTGARTGTGTRSDTGTRHARAGMRHRRGRRGRSNILLILTWIEDVRVEPPPARRKVRVLLIRLFVTSKLQLLHLLCILLRPSLLDRLIDPFVEPDPPAVLADEDAKFCMELPLSPFIIVTNI
jgi:hypothetical protein